MIQNSAINDVFGPISHTTNCTSPPNSLDVSSRAAFPILELEFVRTDQQQRSGLCGPFERCDVPGYWTSIQYHLVIWNALSGHS